MGTEEAVASRLRRLRLEKKLTLAEMAERTGVSRPTIWSWETGKSTPRRNKVAALANALEIPESELILGPDAVTQVGSNVTLEQEVTHSRERIAASAGVSPDRVKISIVI